MSKDSITKKRTDELIGDASWLKTEAEALKGIIDAIPYNETIPDGLSVIEELFRLEYLQRTYYRPFFEQFHSDSSARIQLQDPQTVTENFETDHDEMPAVESILDRLAGQRAMTIHVLKGLAEDVWRKEVRVGSERVTVFALVEEMVQRDRHVLRSIAELVLLFRQESEAKRELKGAHQGKSGSSQNMNESPPPSVE